MVLKKRVIDEPFHQGLLERGPGNPDSGGFLFNDKAVAEAAAAKAEEGSRFESWIAVKNGPDGSILEENGVIVNAPATAGYEPKKWSRPRVSKIVGLVSRQLMPEFAAE